MTRSEELFNRAVKRIPGGVNSPVRAYGAIGEVPRFIDHADGCYIYDADGNLVISISDTADNFDLLAQNLEWHNKKIKEVSRLEMLRALPRELIKEIRKSRHKER